MGYKLCTTEKPSVARDIAKVVGANEKNHCKIDYDFTVKRR